MLKNFKLPKKFSYSAKDVTIAAIVDVSGGRLGTKLQEKIINRATELVGIVPFDWERKGNDFNMFFGADTIELAVAAQKRLQESNFRAHFWTEEDGIAIAAKVFRDMESQGVEVEPMTRVIDGPDGPGVEIIDWRDADKAYKYRN